MTFIKFGYLNITGRTADLTNYEDKTLSIRKPQVSQKIPSLFMETEVSLPYSQQSHTGSCPEPEEFDSCSLNLFL
jgi:hypothetical protein